MEEENDLQDLEELTEEEQVTQPNEVSIEEPPIVFSSMLEAIQLTINAPLFYFTISEQQSRPVTQGAGIGMFAPATVITDQRFYTLGDVLTGNVYVKHIPREFNDRFKKLVTNPGEDAQTELVSLLEDVGRHLQDNDAKQTVELGEGNTKSTLIVEFDKDKTMEGNVNLATGDAESINVSEYADVIEQLDFVKINKERKEAEEKAAAEESTAGVQIVDASGGPLRTSAPAWGFKTDNQGLIENSKGEMVEAPFFKGEEYSMFEFELEADDIFRLQKQMEAAGMDAPPVTEYGQWTSREANFMALIFSRATDTGQWEIDTANGLQGWETTLKEVSENNQAVEGFVKLLRDGKYGQEPVNATPAQIQQILDAGAASLGITLSAKDYTDYAYVVTNALKKEATLIDEYNRSAVTDSDIIRGASFRDVRSMEEGEYARYLKAGELPLVIPSYESLTGQKGIRPQLASAQEIVTEQLKKIKANQIQGQQDLNNLRYTTNLFESAMGQIEFMKENT
tara:strand:- start:1657 stop:3186 length:1530 start_codon:yes stop_codon:yes gene_type:complete